MRAKRRAALAQLDSLTQSLFLDLFGDAIKNPHGSPVRPMIELIDPQRPISYGILMPGPDHAEGVKYVRVTDMKNGGNLGDGKLMPIILPLRAAQDKFARQANVVEALKTAQRASLAEVDALFSSLQHRAFRGEL